MMAVSFLCALFAASPACADEPLEALSDKKFNSALSEMVSEYEKDGITQAAASRNPYITERLILRSMDPNVDPQELGAVDAIKDKNGTYILQFDSVQDTKDAEEALLLEPGTVYVEPDLCVFAKGTISLYPKADSDVWGQSARAIGADVLGNALKGLSGSVTVAVLDTGVSYTAEELKNRIDRANANSLVYGCSPDQSQEGLDNLLTSAGHGTHVAGIIAQCTQEAADKVKILPVRVLDNEGGGYLSDVALGVRYAAQKGAKVINLSLGGPAGSSSTMKDAVDYATGLGSVVVVAAGNENQSTLNCDPARIESCIVVGAVDESNRKASFSNYGPTLDVMAPGTSIYSNYCYYVSKYNQLNWYRRMSGTSMATPHASGAAALVRLACPGAGPEETERILQLSAKDLGEPGWDPSYGFGLLDLSSVFRNRSSLLRQASQDVISIKEAKAAEARQRAAEEAAKKKAAEDAAKKKAAEEAAKKKAAEEAAKEAAKKKAEEEARKAAEEASFARICKDSTPHANADYVIPLQCGQTTGGLKVDGLGAHDYVVSWASSDPSIICVDGRPDGTCIVTAGNTPGNAMISAVTASRIMVSFEVRVQKKKVALKGVAVPSKKITLTVGQSYDLQAEPKPVSAGKPLKYSSSRKSVATVSGDGVITARDAGKTVITVRCGKKKVRIRVTVVRP